jgi:hypothetical protein
MAAANPHKSKHTSIIVSVLEIGVGVSAGGAQHAGCEHSCVVVCLQHMVDVVLCTSGDLIEWLAINVVPMTCNAAA